MPSRSWIAAVAAFAVLTSAGNASQPAGPPYAPADALTRFRLADGFQIETFASEPLVESPVAMEVDEHGRLFVVEMPGYPLDVSGSGRIVVLDDTNRDGRPDRRTVFAEGLRLPTGIMRWKQGVIVTDSPQVWYLEDSDRDGRADIKRELLTGFALTNPQHTTNSPVYGLDNWIYLANEGPVRTIRYRDIFGDAGGEIHFPDRPQGPRLPPDAEGRNVRFRPDTFQLEMLASRSQFGQTFDAWGHHFNVTNNRHMFHEVMPARYLTRNPALVVASAIEQVPDYKQPAEVFPITADPQFQLLTDVGVMTSASGLTWYLGDLFPPSYRAVAFVAEGAHNLVHALTVRDHGVTFRGSRVLDGREFLASTDAWFRPVNLYVGPDGALYVIDYYRRIFEHPEWLDDATARSPDLTSGRERGRIYRITPTPARGTRAPVAAWLDRLTLGDASPAQLVRALSHQNAWWRRHAQRLLVDRRPAESVGPLAQLAGSTTGIPEGRVHALWTLQGMQRLTATVIERALHDPAPGVRENAVRLAELHVPRVPTMAASLLKLASDPDEKVRFQLLLTLGAVNTPEAAAARSQLLFQHVEDDWMQLAALSAARVDTAALFEEASRRLTDRETPARRQMFNRLASLAAADPQPADVVRLIARVSAGGGEPWWRSAALEGVAAGLKPGQRQAAALDESRAGLVRLLDPSEDARLRRAALQLFETIGLPSIPTVADAVTRAERIALDPQQPDDSRADAVRLLALADSPGFVPAFRELLGRAEPLPVQVAAVRAWSGADDPGVAAAFVDLWGRWTPGVRDEALRMLVGRPDRVKALLDAIDGGTIRVSEIAWPQRVRLMMSDDDDLRARARGFFGQPSPPSETLDRYRPALQFRGDARRGREVFARSCSACHQYRGTDGIAFGPDLAQVRGHLPASLLADILNPGQAIADGFELWIVGLTDGTTVSGIIASETPASVTLRLAGGGELGLARSRIASMRIAELSAMPRGLEDQIDQQQMADLIAFIRESR